MYFGKINMGTTTTVYGDEKNFSSGSKDNEYRKKAMHNIGVDK